MQHLAKSARRKASGPFAKWSWVGGDIIRTAPAHADQMDETSMGTLRAVAISELSQPLLLLLLLMADKRGVAYSAIMGWLRCAIRFC